MLLVLYSSITGLLRRRRHSNLSAIRPFGVAPAFTGHGSGDVRAAHGAFHSPPPTTPRSFLVASDRESVKISNGSDEGIRHSDGLAGGLGLQAGTNRRHAMYSTSLGYSPDGRFRARRCRVLEGTSADLTALHHGMSQDFQYLRPPMVLNPRETLLEYERAVTGHTR